MCDMMKTDVLYASLRMCVRHAQGRCVYGGSRALDRHASYDRFISWLFVTELYIFDTKKLGVFVSRLDGISDVKLANVFLVWLNGILHRCAKYNLPMHLCCSS